MSQDSRSNFLDVTLLRVFCEALVRMSAKATVISRLDLGWRIHFQDGSLVTQLAGQWYHWHSLSMWLLECPPEVPATFPHIVIQEHRAEATKFANPVGHKVWL